MRGIKWIAVVLAVCFGVDGAIAQCGLTSYYGSESGKWTASGERFNPNAFTAAHRTLPFGTILMVQKTGSPLAVMVRINDRGPAKWTGRDLDLSLGAARVLDFVKTGVVKTCWN